MRFFKEYNRFYIMENIIDKMFSKMIKDLEEHYYYNCYGHRDDFLDVFYEKDIFSYPAFDRIFDEMASTKAGKRYLDYLSDEWDSAINESIEMMNEPTDLEQYGWWN